MIRFLKNQGNKNPTMMRPAKNILSALLVVLMFTVTGWVKESHILAQGTVNINVTGIPPLLPSPLVSDLVTGYETGRYTMQVLYTSPRQVPAEFRLRVQLTHNGTPAVETLSDPFFLMPGTYFYSRFTDMPEIPFSVTLSNLIQQMPSTLRDAAFRGVLAEGLYQLTFELVPEQQTSGILSIPANTFFNVQYAQPPVLFTPANNAVLAQPQPVFSWTPVIVPSQFRVEYELLIAEIVGDQTPLQAIEGATFPVVQTTLSDQTIFIYTPEFLPLEPGKRYAWTVTASTGSQAFPFVNNGRSEILVFDYMEASGSGEQISMLSEIVLEPGFARLTDFQNTRFSDDGFSYSLNGPATLELLLDGVPTVLLVELENLRIQNTGLENAILMGGRLAGNASSLVSLFDPEDLIRPDRLSWIFGSGFNLTAILLTPDQKEVALRGDLRLTALGVSGELVSVQRPVTQAEGGGHRIILNEIRVVYPGGLRQFAGEVDLFNGDLRCEGDIYDMTSESISSYVRCDETRTINLTDSSPGITLTVTDGRGDLQIGWNGDLLDMEVLITGDIGLDVTGQFNCSLTATLLFRPDDVEIVSVMPSCLPGSRLNIGFGEIALHRFRLREINWSTERGWEPETEASGDIELPLENDETLEGRPRQVFRLPPVEPVVFNRRGVRLPPIEFDEDELDSSPPFGVGRMRAKPKRFRQGEKEFPWREIAGRDPGSEGEQPDEAGSWDFEMDFDLDFEEERTESQAPPLPECLRNSPVRVTGARFTNGRLSASVDAIRENGPCRIPLTAVLDEETGLTLEITELGGDVEGMMAPGGFTTRVNLRSRAQLTGTSILNCGSGGVIASGNLNLNPAGVPSGSIQVHNTCSMDLTPFTARINEGLVVLDYTKEHPLLLTTGLSVQYPTGDGSELTANGIMRADLLTPEILELEIELTGPVALDIPEEEPVLRFVLNRVLLNKEGYTVNGSQHLMAGNTRVDTRFEDVFMRYDREGIASGRIHIDGDFTLMALLGAQGTDFRIGPHGQFPAGMSGAALHLTGPVVIDSTGMKLLGGATASVRLEGLDIPDLRVEFRDDFRIQPDPFRTEQGRIDLFRDERRVAWIDRDGLHPDPSYFNLTPPDRIVLPTEQVAYIDLKEGDDYVLDLEPMPDGNLRLRNRAGQQPLLTVPALQGNRPNAPAFPFTLNDVIIDPVSMSLISGSIIVDIPDMDGINLTDIGIPLQLRRIMFGEIDYNGIPVLGFYLQGFLRMFDGIMVSTEPASLLVLPDGTIEGFLDLSGIDGGFDVLPGGNVRIGVDDIAGHIRIPVRIPELATWDFTVGGELHVAIAGTGSATAGVSLRVQHTGVSVNSFLSGTREDGPEGTACTRDGSSLRVDKYNALSLSWSQQDGFDFYFNTDITFCAYSVEEVYTVPLSSVALQRSGLHVPAQEKHRHSDPPLNLPVIRTAGVHMLPITIRVPEIEASWTQLDRADYSSFLPRFDFEVTFPDFEDRSPMIAEAKLTLADAGITDGVLSGMILPYTFPGDGVPVPLADPVQNPPVLMVKTIGGGIRRVETPEGPQQKYEFTFDGQLRNLARFNNLQKDRNFSDEETGDTGNDPNRPGGRYQDCSDPEVTLTYTPPMGFEAVLSGIRPCGWLELGPVQIEVDESTFTFRYEDGDQLLHLDGDVSIYLLHPDLDNGFTRIAGFLGLDLMTGTIREGSLEITESFRWYLPDESSRLFTFTVNRARLDFEGLTLQGQAGLRAGEIMIPIDFEDYHYNFAQERFTRGRTRINHAFAIELELTDRLAGRLVDPESPFTAVNAMRLSAEAGMMLDADGMKLTGASTAAFRLGDNDFPDLTVVYEPEGDQPFTLRPEPGAMPPVRVIRGRADLMLGNSRVAWYDSDGFHLDDVLALLPIPERIGLPTELIAYLDTRVGDTDIPVEAQRTDNGYIVRTKPGRQVDLFITGLDRNNPPRVAVTFEVGVDDAFNITSGEIEADLTDNPIDLRPLADLPLDLVKIRYKSKDGLYRLEADARLKLPGHLEPVDVLVEELTFDENGFRQLTFSAGSFTDSYDPSIPSMKDIRFGSGDTEIMEIMGVRIAFGQVNSVAFSGVFKSQFLKADGTNDPAPVFYSATWQAGQGSGDDRWAVALGFDETQRLPVGSGRLTIEDLAARINSEGFSIEVTGSLFMPDLMGSNFRVRVEDLVVGTGGVSLRSGTVQGNHQFDLFEGIAEGQITRLSAEIDNNRVLFVSADGNLRLLGHPMEFTNLRVGTNGSFSIDQADLLPGDAKLDIIENTAWLSTLQLGVANNRISLNAGGTVRLPEPLNASSGITLGLSYNEDGAMLIDGPRVDLVLGEPGSNYRIGSGPVEIPVGDLATLALTGIAVDVDLYEVGNSAFYSTAILFIENNDNKRLNFGDSGKIFEEPGIYIQRGRPIEWNMASHGRNLFEFDAGFFRLQVDGVRTFDSTVFGVSIDGEVGIVIGGNGDILKGRTGFTDLQIAMPANPEADPNPIRRWPDFAGLSVTIMDIIALELGVFDFGFNQSITITKGDNPDNITEETVEVREYLRFYNPLEGASAISISLTDAFSGGVEEILIYRDINDTFLLYIRNANLSLGGVGALNINFRMLVGEGQLSLLAAGGGNITGLGGLAAAGKFGVDTRGPTPLLSFGVFFAIRSETAIPLIPMAPPAVGLNGIGGGFFFRPESQDLDAVYAAVGAMDPALGFMLQQRGLPPTDANFAAMVYASFAMVAAGPFNAYEGSIFLELTDNYVSMTAAGSLVKQGASITAGMTAMLNWSNLSLSGRLAARIGYDPVLHGEGNLGFNMAINVPLRRIDWVVDGDFEARIVGIGANGSMIVSPAGLYAELTINANIPSPLVTFDGEFTARTWIIPNPTSPLDSELGAFAQARLSVSVAGVASVTGLANGTFITKNGMISLYLLASAQVEVFGVPAASIWGFAEFRDNQIRDAGILFDVDDKLLDLMDEARNMANEMNEKSDSAKNAVNEASGVFNTNLSNEILAKAGSNYFNLSQSGFGAGLNLILDAAVVNAVSYLFTPTVSSSIPQALQWVNTNIKRGESAPNRTDVNTAATNMRNRLSEANAYSDGVIRTINENQALALQWLADAEMSFNSLVSPIGARGVSTRSAGEFSIQSTVPFTVDESQAGTLSSNVAEAVSKEDTFAELEPGYMAAIQTATDNLTRLNRILKGSSTIPGVIEQGRRYSVARQAVGEYFARRASHFHELHRWSNTKHQALLANETAIKSAVTSTRDAYLNLTASTSTSRCQNLRGLLDPLYGLPDCTNRRHLGMLVAMKQREAVLVLSGSTYTNTWQTIRSLSDAMHTDLDNRNFTILR
jgi:large repetitive protein